MKKNKAQIYRITYLEEEEEVEEYTITLNDFNRIKDDFYDFLDEIASHLDGDKIDLVQKIAISFHNILVDYELEDEDDTELSDTIEETNRRYH